MREGARGDRGGGGRDSMTGRTGRSTELYTGAGGDGRVLGEIEGRWVLGREPCN